MEKTLKLYMCTFPPDKYSDPVSFLIYLILWLNILEYPRFPSLRGLSWGCLEIKFRFAFENEGFPSCHSPFLFNFLTNESSFVSSLDSLIEESKSIEDYLKPGRKYLFLLAFCLGEAEKNYSPHVFLKWKTSLTNWYYKIKCLMLSQ